MKFLVLGAGRMGYATVYDLVRSPKVEKIVIADIDLSRVEKIAARFPDKQVIPVELDVDNQDEVAQLMHEVDVAIACVSSGRNYELAKIALSTKTHLVDMGGDENVASRQFLLDDLAREQDVTIVPDMSMAPGLVSLLAVSAAESLDQLYEIKLRVGVLPGEPEELFMGYSQVRSVEELVEEYQRDCQIVRDGKLVSAQSLTDVEVLEFPRPFGMLEAFLTSGGIGRLAADYAERCPHIDFKTIRYSGHCSQIKMLRELGMMSLDPVQLEGGEVVPRQLLVKQLKERLSADEPDVAILRVVVTGIKDKKPVQIIWDCIDLADQAAGLTAMMRMTAFPASIVAQMIARGDIKERGVLRLENTVPIKLFLAEMDGRGINMKMTERAPILK